MITNIIILSLGIIKDILVYYFCKELDKFQK